MIIWFLVSDKQVLHPAICFATFRVNKIRQLFTVVICKKVFPNVTYSIIYQLKSRNANRKYLAHGETCMYPTLITRSVWSLSTGKTGKEWVRVNVNPPAFRNRSRQPKMNIFI